MQRFLKILLIIVESLALAGGMWAVLQFRIPEFKKLNKEQKIVLLVAAITITVYLNTKK